MGNGLMPTSHYSCHQLNHCFHFNSKVTFKCLEHSAYNLPILSSQQRKKKPGENVAFRPVFSYFD